MHQIIPRTSVDNIPFGSDIQTLRAAGYVEDESGFEEITGWRTFKKDDDLEFYIRDGSVVCAACFKNCCVDGVAMIGQLPTELLYALGDPDEIGDAIWVTDERQQTPYEYFALGLQFWIESDRVVSVFCNDAY